MPNKTTAVKNATTLAAYLLIVWGFYRFIFKFPEEIEDLIIKPLLWLTPLVLLLRKERKGLSSIGVTFKNLFPSIYMSLVLGAIFALVGALTNYFKYGGGLSFTSNIGETSFYTALLLSLATGITEETVFRGFIFNRFWHGLGDEWKANYLTSVIWGLVHIPVAIFWWKLDVLSTTGVLLLIVCFGIGSSYIFARTKNITSSILLHMMWSWPIILFR